MKQSLLLIILIFQAVLFTSCAPVRFSKSEVQSVPGDCAGTACSAAVNSIKCDPKINGNQMTYSYPMASTTYPNIVSNCNPPDVTYEWIVKRPDSSVVTAVVPGLSGKDPTNVNFTALGQGTYYVFLKAYKAGSGLMDYMSVTPLEFVVPGTGVGNSLTCDPKLNGNQVSVVVGAADNNPVVTANCMPAAATYLWTVTKDGKDFTAVGLSGATSTPNFKSFGAGVYRIYLYATATGSTHWRSSSPLTVTVASQEPVTMAEIQCNPRINGTQTQLTLTASSPNPLISANCIPGNVQYAWTVTKNGINVPIPELTGANSNPNFLALGRGTYQIFLKATAPNYLPWNTTSPLVITVDDVMRTLTINCAPRLNTLAVSVMIPTTGQNPVVTANCTPPNVQHTWVVLKDGKTVTVAGLAGASSTGQFIQSGAGTYYIYLTATAPGYNAYVSPSPLEVIVMAPGGIVVPVPTYRDLVYDRVVSPSNNKVDILLVIDDSNSMLVDNKKLAEKLEGFVKDLSDSGLNWQMCATVTRWQDDNAEKIPYWGLSRKWVNYIGVPQWLLTAGANNPYAIFNDTITQIGAGWANSDDERGIKAAWYHAEYAKYNTCYRPDASIAVILISDEDVRSIGGNMSYLYYENEFKALEADDYPQNYLIKVKQEFGAEKKFTFNSIIVKPGDSACMAAQDAGNNSKSHYGFKYQELSQLTGGGVGSICSENYSSSLYYFKDRIVNSMASVQLECAPVGGVTVLVTPAMNPFSYTLQNNTVVFNPAVPAGRNIKIQYKCAVN